MHNLFLSHRLDALVDRLILQFDENPIGPLETRTILIPHSQMKQWLLLEIAKRTGIAMGLNFVDIAQVYPSLPSSLEMFCSIYQSLLECTDSELQAYLEGKEKRLIDLTKQLVSLFFTYGQYGKALFKEKSSDWQQTILKKLPFLLPVQLEPVLTDPIICFGVDYLPPIYWEYLFRATSLSIYAFSPCFEFWGDVCTERERKNLDRFWKKQSVSKESRHQLDAYLRQAPKNLSNWGKIGRETLKIFDSYSLEIEEVYPPLQPDSLLKQIQSDLLTFQETKTEIVDDSIKIFLTGSSRLKEVECLRDEILRLDIPFHEISVLAPDIEPYVPLIEFVFSDLIPYRISGFDIAPQSSFRQGLIRLCHLASGRWEAEAVLTLFETPSFYRKQGWDQEKLEMFRSWIATAQIKWGWDNAHRQEVLSQMLGEKNYQDQNSWEKGLDRLLNALIYLSPQQINADLFEEFLAALFALRNIPLSGKKTLTSWADCLENAAEQFLLADINDEADLATQNSFHQFLQDLRKCNVEGLFPFAAIQDLLARPCSGQIHSSHLHAVRFAPIEDGAQMPVRALFLIGMDEESFPRLKTPSSLDLLRKEKIPDQADRDRYHFLQALFSAVDILRISYCHLSADEGKPVGPSLLVQELSIKNQILYAPPTPQPKSNVFSWPNLCQPALPEGEITLSISDLKKLAQHPWKFYLQKVLGMYLNESLEESFALQKGSILRAALEKPLEEVLTAANLPPGLLGEALKLEIIEKNEERQLQLNEWQLKPFSLIFRENCTQRQWEESNCILPPIELEFDRLKVRLVGEIKQATLKGLVCANDDTIGGLIKAWPEALAVALSLDAPQIWMLKSGKEKNLEEPKESLKQFVEYYFRSLKAPSPLLSDWADPLLRKGLADLEKKIQKGSTFEDPFVDWVLDRIEVVKAEEILETWGPYLKGAFSGLISLYPTRSTANLSSASRR